MLAEEGGFYSAQDADSEGIEGKFFLWTVDQVAGLLGDGASAFNQIFGVTREGNFYDPHNPELLGRNVLSRRTDPFPATSGLDRDAFDARMERWRTTLFEARAKRIPPETDDKVLTSWNGLAMRAFAEAGGALGRQDYVEKANINAKFLLDSLVRDGRLLRTYRNGEAKLNGYLEDYAFLIDGLLVLHEATLDGRWLDESISLGEAMVDLFWEESEGRFYDTGRDHEELVLRPRDYTDNATPCGSSMAADVLLRLAVITGDSEYQRRAVTSLRSVRELMSRFPTGAGHWLGALDFYLSTPKEIAIVGGAGDAETNALLSEVSRRYLPNRVLVGSAGDGTAETRSGVPLLEDRDRVNGRPTAYVCENYACNFPVTEPAALAAQLAS